MSWELLSSPPARTGRSRTAQ
jgi:hypothetical protein